MKTGWIIITKSFKGGQSVWAVRLTRAILSHFPTWRELLEYVGDNTDGGHNYGYFIRSSRRRQRPDRKIKRLTMLRRFKGF